MEKENTKVLMVVTNSSHGWYWAEFAHPYIEFKGAGWKIDIASCAGGSTTCDPSSIEIEVIEKDPVEKALFGRLNELMSNTFDLSKIDAKNYQIIFFVGGFGAMWDYPFSSAVANVTRDCYENGGTVSGVCHGPIFLANVKLSDGSYLIKGKEFTAFSDEEENFIETNYKVGKLSNYPMHEGKFRTCHEVLSDRGGIAKQSTDGVFKPCVVYTDPRLVTGQNPSSAKPLGRKLVELMGK
jgi:putative intracellular protease/amidase